MDVEHSSRQLQVGQIVKIIRGRDRGKYAVVIDHVDDRFVLIADGDKRKFDSPKKKNFIHLEPQDELASEVVDSMSESGRVTNGKLRHVIRRYTDKINLDTQTRKGE